MWGDTFFLAYDASGHSAAGTDTKDDQDLGKFCGNGLFLQGGHQK